jgi:hypothetical protein
VVHGLVMMRGRRMAVVIQMTRAVRGLRRRMGIEMTVRSMRKWVINALFGIFIISVHFIIVCFIILYCTRSELIAIAFTLYCFIIMVTVVIVRLSIIGGVYHGPVWTSSRPRGHFFVGLIHHRTFLKVMDKIR